MHDEPADVTDEEPKDAEPAVDATETTPSGGGRGWKVAAVIAVLAAAVSVGVLGSLLLGGGGGSDEPDADVRACVPSRDFTKESDGSGDECPPEGAEKMDGLVQKTNEGGFTIRRIEGGSLGEEVELHVRKADRPYIDIAHAQTHAALGQPIRVYLEEIEGEDAVVYMEDAPLVR